MSGPFMISVDPGLNGCGVAIWNVEKHLERASYVKNPGDDFVSMVLAVARTIPRFSVLPNYLVTELPQVYTRTRSKGDPNDLISLALFVGALAFYAGRGGYKLYKPAEWKGQVTKEITELRAKKRLTSDELAKIELPSAKSLAHNVWDAVALGLVHLYHRSSNVLPT
jgi:Holliday junction resolvasome RuvABC endonuclease subunit